MWDSQRVTTPLQHCVYGGPLLPPARSFYWDVEWFVGDLSQGRSPSVVFDTAPTEWTGSSWIGTNVNMFRKEFMVTAAGPLKVFVAGLGFSQVYINSQRLGSDVLTGAWTTFNERVRHFYLCYVLALLFLLLSICLVLLLYTCHVLFMFYLYVTGAVLYLRDTRAAAQPERCQRHCGHAWAWLA